MGHALVGSVNGFLAARLGLGLGEGGNSPSAIKVVALWFPPGERAYATALFNSGSNVGAIIAPAVVPWLALTFGWRSAFVAAGIAGLLWLLLWIPLHDLPDRVARVGSAELAYIRGGVLGGPRGTSGVATTVAIEGPEKKLTWSAILRHRQAWAFIVCPDERPVQLLDPARPSVPMKAGRVRRSTTSTSGQAPPTSSASSSPRLVAGSPTHPRTAPGRPLLTRCIEWVVATVPPAGSTWWSTT
jgi:hypothetical protein